MQALLHGRPYPQYSIIMMARPVSSQGRALRITLKDFVITFLGNSKSVKNMCSVRQIPTPSAPISQARRASRSVSALVRAPSYRTLRIVDGSLLQFNDKVVHPPALSSNLETAITTIFVLSRLRRLVSIPTANSNLHGCTGEICAHLRQRAAWVPLLSVGSPFEAPDYGYSLITSWRGAIQLS